MKQFKRKSDIELALELAQIDHVVKEYSKRRDEIKDYFKEKIESGEAKCGAILFTIDFQKREVVDKRLLKADLGEKASKYISLTEYRVMKFRKVS